MRAAILAALGRRYGDEYVAEAIGNIKELVGNAIGAVLLFAGIIGVWFIGCAAL